jgi:hypothetical protein
LVELDPSGTLLLAEAGCAGGGAINLMTSTPYVSAPSHHSWTVHIVISSFGSTLVKE